MQQGIMRSRRETFFFFIRSLLVGLLTLLGCQLCGIATGQGPDVEFLQLQLQPPSPPNLDEASTSLDFAHPDTGFEATDSIPLSLGMLPAQAAPPVVLPSEIQSTIDVWEATLAGGRDDFAGYRNDTSSTSWILGNGNQFGMMSFNFGTTFQRRGVANGLATGFQWHLLSGPDNVHLPPRVYDFLIGYQARDWIGNFGYDISAKVSASSDFEGSARDGIRFPSHAVGYIRLAPWADFAFGIDYFDRKDVSLLPVGGLILRPNHSTEIQLVFPRPRIDKALSPTKRLYLSGEYGGGEWAIVRELSLASDVLTYTDLRLAVGIETTSGPAISGVELAWLFNRKIEFTSGADNSDLQDTVMLRFVHSQ